MRGVGVLPAIGAGLIVAAAIGWLGNAVHHRPPHADTRLVAEDASAPIRELAIHYAPAADGVALGVWTQLAAVLPPAVQVDVEVTERRDFDRLLAVLRASGAPHLARYRPIVVGQPITTWSRDRFAALVDEHGHGAILAPPHVDAPFVQRAGDAQSPFALSQAIYGTSPRIADLVFEGGDLAATPSIVFADVNLGARNLGRGAADRASIEHELGRWFAQRIVWLGEQVGDVPRHHIMMYMVPLDDHVIAVGDVRAGLQLLAGDPGRAAIGLDPDEAEQADRFDRAAAELAGLGFAVVRVPALVLAGGGAFVTYTNAVFDRAGAQRIVYLPTYALPSLDAAATRFYERLGYVVKPIDVSPIFRLDGSLGCLVNVLARGDGR
jgi:hypothetical protein